MPEVKTNSLKRRLEFILLKYLVDRLQTLFAYLSLSALCLKRIRQQLFSKYVVSVFIYLITSNILILSRYYMLNYGNSENFRSFGRQIDTDIFFFLTPQVN